MIQGLLFLNTEKQISLNFQPYSSLKNLFCGVLQGKVGEYFFQNNFDPGIRNHGPDVVRFDLGSLILGQMVVVKLGSVISR